MMFKNFFLSLLFLFVSTEASLAQVRHAAYDVSYGIFGKIGTAKATLTKEHKTYQINIKLQATGIAKLLSRGREEQHLSKGRIVNGVMRSEFYQVIKSHGDVRVSKEYTIDHKSRRVKKRYRKYQEGKLITDRTSYLDFYAEDDLLTLYFNLDRIIKNKHQPKTYHFKAVGAERQKGEVSVTIPDPRALQSYNEALGKDAAWYATAIIHQKIFSSKEGRLMLAIAKDGITNKALLKDVIFFGDIRATRINQAF